MGFEGAVMYNLFKHVGEVEGSGVKFSLLDLSQEVLDPRVDTIEEAGDEHVIAALEPTVSDLVYLCMI